MAMFEILKGVRPRGIRFSLPSGFFLGRVSPGEGDAELIPLAALANRLTKTGLVEPGPVDGGGGGSTPAPVDAGIFLTGGGTLFSSQYYPFAMASQDVSFPSGTLTSLASAQIAPTTNTATFYVTSSLADYAANGPAGANTLFSVVFTSGMTTGTVTSLTPGSIVRGTVLYLVLADTFNDPTIMDIQIIVRGDPA